MALQVSIGRNIPREASMRQTGLGDEGTRHRGTLDQAKFILRVWDV